jgi:hypothetical protein
MIKSWIKDRENSSQAKSLSLFVYSRKLSDHRKKRQNVVFIDCYRMIAIITYRATELSQNTGQIHSMEPALPVTFYEDDMLPFFL